MRAAKRFLESLTLPLAQVARIQVSLHGSLAHTGVGHGTNHAIIYGLAGFDPETISSEQAHHCIESVLQNQTIALLNTCVIPFKLGDDLLFDYEHLLPGHSNGMRFTCFSDTAEVLAEATYYSIGGGFILREGEAQVEEDQAIKVPYPFTSSKTLLEQCAKSGLSIAGVKRANECCIRSHQALHEGLLELAAVMFDCIERGCQTEGLLNGQLQVKRRAPGLYRKLRADGAPAPGHPQMMNWVNVFAMAVNEENAAGGKVVTAPTNGAAGIIPAVLAYYRDFYASSDDGVVDFLLTAGAIGSLFKRNASISGAEMGCQGEVGVACSMAAAGLAAALGGTPSQVEQAAEIGIEHNLGLTCDPVDGLVQIPCIERNAMGAIKAINAAHLALAESGDHKVTLDMAIHSMREIGENMHAHYKETSRGGLAVAVNVIEC
jgi:L-serine dehydratase